MCGGKARRNGTTHIGKKRFFCVSCHHSFIRKKHILRDFVTFMQFHDFVVGNVNKNGLTEQTHSSRTTLWRKFLPFFNYQSTPDNLVCSTALPPVQSWIYGVDGKWLRRNGVIIIHRNITTKETIYWSYHPSESYAAYESDVQHVIQTIGNNKPLGAISDWKGAIVAAVDTSMQIPHQRCLTHVVREAKRYLPKTSSFAGIQELRALAKDVIHITTIREKRQWIVRLIRWEKHYGLLLREKTIGMGTGKKWWYTHGNLRRAWRLLTTDWDPFFVHLTYPLIPHSNNSLEGVISQASQKLSDHRGMKTHQQVSFLFWYFSFFRTKTKQDLKRLWGIVQNKISAV